VHGSGKASNMHMSSKAFDLIVSEDGSCRAHDEATLRHLEWQGEASGVFGTLRFGLS
jgi:hypothetical protein